MHLQEQRYAPIVHEEGTLLKMLHHVNSVPQERHRGPPDKARAHPARQVHIVRKVRLLALLVRRVHTRRPLQAHVWIVLQALHRAHQGKGAAPTARRESIRVKGLQIAPHAPKGSTAHTRHLHVSTALWERLLRLLARHNALIVQLIPTQVALVVARAHDVLMVKPLLLAPQAVDNVMQESTLMEQGSVTNVTQVSTLQQALHHA